ncbi:hypothetical protein BGZ47_011033 [Haplosporangium gracile]|nr:hypothetical protein BGZ47_011033 [Haplosporangium gracile]
MASAGTTEFMLAGRPGKYVTVPYIAEEPIYNILYLQGFHSEYHQLPLAEYRVLGGPLTYQSIKKGDISVFVKPLKWRQVTLHRLQPVRHRSGYQEDPLQTRGRPLAQIQLQYQGKILDNEDSLESRGICRMSTLTKSTRVRGGHSLSFFAPMKFADVSNRANVHHRRLTYSHRYPERSVYPGTSVEVKCPCTKLDVISPVRFGTIELSQEKFACPKCENDKTVPVTVGFRLCKYCFYGIKANGT